MITAQEVASQLIAHKNVLLMGPPASGKSTLMNKVAEYFTAKGEPDYVPKHFPDDPVPIRNGSAGNGNPFLKNKKCRVFRTTFHQNYKNRDFISGIIPSFNGTNLYDVVPGILYEANEYAKQSNCIALLIIDEINRGPAVEIFGGSLVAIEPDKRLSENGEVLPTTQFFSIISPVAETKGKMIEYALSPNLYILAAMNQADTSIASLDVAFLRRWFSVRVEPDYDLLYRTFGIDRDGNLPDVPQDPKDVYRAAFMALEKLNELVTAGIGAEYQIGHGVLYGMPRNPRDIAEASVAVFDVWNTMFSQLEELFFKQTSDLAFVLNSSSDSSPFHLETKDFNGRQVFVLESDQVSPENIYDVFRSILGR